MIQHGDGLAMDMRQEPASMPILTNGKVDWVINKPRRPGSTNMAGFGGLRVPESHAALAADGGAPADEPQKASRAVRLVKGARSSKVRIKNLICHK